MTHDPRTFLTPSGMTLNEAATTLDADVLSIDAQSAKSRRLAVKPPPSATETPEQTSARHTRRADALEEFAAECRADAEAMRAGVYPVPA